MSTRSVFRKMLWIGAVISCFQAEVRAQGPPPGGLAGRVQALERQVAAQALRLTALQLQVSVQAQQLVSLRQQILSQAVQIAALRQQAASLRQELLVLGGEVGELTQRVGAMETQIASLQQGADAFAAQLADLAARMSEIELRVTALEGPAGGPRRVTQVDCDAQQSVNAALASLPAGANTLEISGLCDEDVRVQGFNDLWLVGQPGASLRSLTVEQSERIQARQFALAPAGFAAVTVRRSSCDLSSLTIDGGSSASGMLIENGDVVLAGVNSARNVKSGLLIQRHSTVWMPAGALVLEGLSSTSPSDATRGILLAGASLLIASLDGSSAVRGFSVGILAQGNSTANLLAMSTDLVVEANRTDGVGVIAGKASLFGQVLVSGHPSSGLFAFDGGSLEISQGVRIQNNGAGIALRNNAIARIVYGTDFTGNNIGVSVRSQSVVHFAGLYISFSGNATDVSCDAFSLASGASITNATTVSCVNQN
jgi:hypothetical protein